MRPRSGKFEPSRSLGCHFLDQNVAHISPTTPRVCPQHTALQRDRQAQKHMIENRSYSAAPARAAGAGPRRRYHGRLHRKSSICCSRFGQQTSTSVTGGCCSSVAGGCSSFTNVPGRPEKHLLASLISRLCLVCVLPPCDISLPILSPWARQPGTALRMLRRVAGYQRYLLPLRVTISLAYIGTRLRELEIIPYMVQTYA